MPTNATFGVNIIPKSNTVTLGNSDSPWTIVSPSLTGTPTAPTAAMGTNSTQIATTAFVASAIPFSEERLEDALRKVAGVTKVAMKLNYSSSEIDGVAAQSISIMVAGGNANSIANAIAANNTSGLTTVGTLTRDVDGVSIKFSRPGTLTVAPQIILESASALDMETIGSTIKTAVKNYIDGLKIGETLYASHVADVTEGAVDVPFKVKEVILNTTSGNVDIHGSITPAWDQYFTVVSTSSITLTNFTDSLNLSLLATGWSAATPSTQTVTATGVTASNNVVVGLASSATSDELDAYSEGKIMCTAQGSNTLTFTCYETVPDIDIPVTVAILR